MARPKPAEPQVMVSYRFPESTARLITRTAQTVGLSRTKFIQMAVRKAAKDIARAQAKLAEAADTGQASQTGGAYHE